MASGTEDRYKAALTCGLCQDILTDPRTLPCLHNYCLKCLQSLVEKSELQGGCFNCPECRHECNVPQEGVGEFKASPTVTFLLDAYKDSNQSQEPECNTCWDNHEKHTPASIQCLDCNKKLCATCCKWHDSFSKGHKKLELTGDKASNLQAALQSIKERNVYCDVHPTKPKELYCKVDKVVLCQLCYLIDHAGHDCEGIDQTAAKHTKPIGAIITQGKELVNMYQQAIQGTQAYKGELENNAENVTAAINNDMNALIQAIRTKYKSFTEQVMKEKKSNMKQVMSHLGHLELHKAITEGQVNKYCTLVEHGHPVEIAGIVEQIHKKTEEWSKQPQLEYNNKIDIKFTDGKVDEDELVFGSVHIEKVPERENVQLKPLCEPTIDKRQLQEHQIYDITVSQTGGLVTTGESRGTSKIYDINSKFKQDLGKKFSNVCIKPDGHLAFTDHSNTIYIYHPDGTHKEDIVCKGLKELWGITMNTSSGDLLVCDSGTKSVYHINPKTGDITAKADIFKDPLNITCNSKGDILVSDWGANCIKGIDQEGNEVFSYGEQGAGDQQLSYPHGICTDADDYIFVADYGNNRVHLLSPEGDFIKYVLTEKDGLYAVTIHDGKLLVGDSDGQLFTVKYRE